VYGNQSVADIDAVIRRSEIEIPDYELKQGMLPLAGVRVVNDDVLERIIRTIAAIANNGPSRSGTILIGVSDKDSDAEKVKALDGISPRTVGSRHVVGVLREAAALGESSETYFQSVEDGD
jgi:hypothetical protein